jgi:hypothetical protein
VRSVFDGTDCYVVTKSILNLIKEIRGRCRCSDRDRGRRNRAEEWEDEWKEVTVRVR